MFIFQTKTDPLEHGIDKMFDAANPIIEASMKFLHSMGIPKDTVRAINIGFMIAVVLLIGGMLQFLFTKLFDAITRKLGRHERMVYFTDLLNNKIPYLLAIIIPFSFVRISINTVLEGQREFFKIALMILEIYWIIFMARLAIAFVNSIRDYLRRKKEFSDKPLDSFAQVFKIFVIFLTAIFVVSTLLNKDLEKLLTGLGAFSAVLLLIFKDSIVGFVASIQVSANDMVRIGDWVTIPSQGADGDVVKISLTTVKIRAFDNTIVTVPTYSLISSSMQNWRGMKETGCRRIKRPLHIKQSSVRFVTPEDLRELKRIKLITHYIDEKGAEIKKHNEEISADDMLVNGRRFTNLGLFEKYIESYIKNHPRISKEMLCMVRQLEPNEKGVPVEIYCFAKTTEWSEYESIITDIFDHIIAVVPYFDLQIFESISDTSLKHIRNISPGEHPFE
ncbi:mechanosensitive ion channel family protein [Porphyromonas pogonae]|uniref:mechanosensitive ion channel family protein n=1 Tax=Porphyromonas pogonae TaxID=867595 RepID=UPI002E770566|nr:mechanosensitive ion channel domain-containing protein [Porphyromonas pogonae]